jgi:cell division protein FtsZ
VEVLLNNFPLLVIAGVALLLLIVVARSVLAGRRHVEARSIRVVGVGGAGGNAVDGMIRAGTGGVEFVAVNTDAQALRRSLARRRLRIGHGITGGLGTGGDPEVGRRAAEEDSHRIADAIRGADMVFITAGLGGGTGSGAAPVVAAIAREQGTLTLGVVTKPFGFEGARRREVADAAADELRQRVDALVVIPNDRVRAVVEQTTPILDAFQIVDDVLRQSIQGILDVITMPGLVNLDFADVRAILEGGGDTVMGVGRASGEQRALVAAREAMSGPLLEGSINGARSILFNVAGSTSLSLFEVTEAAEAIRAAADPDASVIFGASFDESLDDDVRVTVVATGFGRAPTAESRAADRRAPIVAADRPPIVAAERAPRVAAQRAPLDVAPMGPLPAANEQARPISAGYVADADRTTRRPRVRRAAELASRLMETSAAGAVTGQAAGGPRSAGGPAESTAAEAPAAGPTRRDATPTVAARSEVANLMSEPDLEVPSFLRRERRRPPGGVQGPADARPASQPASDASSAGSSNLVSPARSAAAGPDAPGPASPDADR